MRTAKPKGFLKYIDTESESLSQKDVKPDHNMSDSEPESDEMEVGRKVSPRRKQTKSSNVTRTVARGLKRSQASCLVQETFMDKNRGKHMKNDEIIDKEDMSKVHVGVNKRQRKLIREDSDNDPNKLLEEIANQSEEMEDKHTKSKPSVVNKDGKVKNKSRTRGLSADMSILDDVFFGGKTSEVKKKAPPKLNQNIDKSPRRGSDVENKTSVDKKRSSISDHDSAASSAEEAIHLDTSTLKDDVYTCFDDPSLWKSRKRQTPKRKKTQFRDYTIDSDSDSEDFFGFDKVRKKIPPPKHGRDSELNSVKSVNGSLSLFD